MQTPRAATDAAVSATDEPTARVVIFLSGGRLLVWDPRQIYALRCQHRLVGCLVGALPSNKRQAAQLGPPLSLSFEEALLALQEGVAVVVDTAACAIVADDAVAAAREAVGFLSIPTACAPWASSPGPSLLASDLQRVAGEGRLEHAQVYRDLWRRGWFVTIATKFGADYLGYPGDPMLHHAAHTVHVARAQQPLRPLELLAAARLAHDAKKSAVVAHRTGPEGSVRYLRLRPMGTEWNRRGYQSSHGVAAEGVGPADSGPQHGGLVAAAAACSLADTT